jgi:ribosomal protein S27E
MVCVVKARCVRCNGRQLVFADDEKITEPVQCRLCHVGRVVAVSAGMEPDTRSRSREALLRRRA